jgi:phosphoglycolate phosphatase
METPLRLVIFDVDGTLVDSQDAILASMTYAFETAGRPVPSREAALGIVGLSLPEAMAVLAPDATRDEHLRLTADYKTGHTAFREDGAAVNSAPLYPGAADTIHALDRAGHLISAATGKSRAGLTRFLAHHGLDRIFLGTQTADDAPSKPNPQMILNVLAETGVHAANTVMVGDTEYDMAMAKAAGCTAIGVRWGYHPEDRIRRGGADHLVDRFDQIPGLLSDLWELA